MKTNLTLIRKRLKCTDFKTTSLVVGKYTNTSVTVCYVDSIAEKEVVEKVVQRLVAIDIDGVVDSSYLSRYLDQPKSILFNRVGESEKPDIVVAKLLEGRIAIIVDGSPMVLTVPYLFIEDLQGPVDYQQPNEVTAVGRMMRLVSIILSVMLPALFVSLQKYNYQIIPIQFLITILNATAAIPFSALTEMLIVIIVFDILREANLRMPTAVGMSLSLVGAIVLGDAAVKAGLLGAPAVMVGALSGIGLYTMPDSTLVLSVLRLCFVFIGGLLGIFGIVIALIALFGYMVNLQQLGAPFMAPHAPFIPNDVRQDGVFLSGLADQLKRPKSIPNTNSTRRGKR
jgi:spore germination protein KA